MKAATEVVELPISDDVRRSPSKAASLLALTKPRIAVMVLLTVGVAYTLGERVSPAEPPMALIVALLGTSLVAGGASVWNQVLERDRDARMRRTRGRPLPMGRVTLIEAATLGTGLAVAGTSILALGPHPQAAAVAAVTFLLYAFVYTPLKPVTTLNTAIGAVPGALPGLIGWVAATGSLDAGGWALFLIVFLWQFPHFLAIAWVHREDYARGGHRMLPNVDPSGVLTGRQAVAYALALVPAALLPTVLGLSGRVYFVAALGLSLYYLAAAIAFASGVSDTSARRLMRASFLYLPAILVLLVLDPIPA